MYSMTGHIAIYSVIGSADAGPLGYGGSTPDQERMSGFLLLKTLCMNEELKKEAEKVFFELFDQDDMPTLDGRFIEYKRLKRKWIDIILKYRDRATLAERKRWIGILNKLQEDIHKKTLRSLGLRVEEIDKMITTAIEKGEEAV